MMNHKFTLTERLTLPPILVTASATLLVSQLPNILWQESTGAVPTWLFSVKLVFLLTLIAGGYLSQLLKPLRSYFFVLIALYVTEFAVALIGEVPQWTKWFSTTSFATNLLGIQILRLVVALIMVVVLFAIKRQFSDFYLVKGQFDAPVGPISWLGVNDKERWSRFGMITAVCISLGTLVFLLIAGLPTVDNLAKVLPMLPIILLLALMNSFSEEMSYRAALLAPLRDVLNHQEAILVTGVFFGIGHFYGVPYGVIGVFMASFLGWLLGKAMIETQGFFWPWFIHFLQDMLIFSFMAIGAVAAGGQ